MLEKDATQREVENLVLGNESEPSAEETPKDESSADEVKTEEKPAEETPEPEKEPEKAEEPEKEPEPEPEPEKEPEPQKPAEPVNVEKLQSQVENLNIALKKERDEGKNKNEALEKKLEDATAMLARLKGAFAPEPEPEPEPTPEQQQYMTPQQVEEMLERREAERTQKQEEEQRLAAINADVKEQTTKWDGKDGKPKYSDPEVLAWQKENDRLYLSPSEAFAIMKSKEILDWEVKQRLSKQKPTQDVESPSITPGEHEPGEITPKTEAETRNAVLEAMNNAEAEI